MRRRLCQRFTKRLEVTFTSSGSKFRGISSDLSAGGLFIRTQHGMTPGSQIEIEVYLPEGKVGILKGIVRRTVKTPLNVGKNGMGIELIERDPYYLEFLKNFDIGIGPEEAGQRSRSVESDDQNAAEANTEKPARQAPEFVIIVCQSCSAKNKVPKERLQFSPKCGKCGTLLDTKDSV